nr:hypothetical protein RVX_2204 [Nitratidesulfovibrio sp. HK-II]
MLDHALPRCRRSVTRPVWSCRGHHVRQPCAAMCPAICLSPATLRVAPKRRTGL